VSSPYINRFLQPDSLVPDQKNPQAWNRYGYVTNRPIDLNDPTGHEYQPPCIFCNIRWLNYSDMSLLVQGALDFATVLACLPLGCNADPTTHTVWGPTHEQYNSRLVPGPMADIVLPESGYVYWNRKTTFKGITVYQRDDLIDPDLVTRDGITNLETMQKGNAPFGPDANRVNLHHLIQEDDGALAEIGQRFHQQNSSTIHINPNTIPSGINRSAFTSFKLQYWKSRALDFLK
jgi:A nuclease of the HNH/ENDO VII superfamily with conserved LHH